MKPKIVQISGERFTKTEKPSSVPGSGPALERLIRLAARVFRAQAAMLSLPSGKDRRQITPFDLRIEDAARLDHFCAETVRHGGVLAVADMTSDAQFKIRAAVSGRGFVRFFAGVPVHSRETGRTGVLCVMDDRPRPFLIGTDERAALEDVARLVGEQLDAGRSAKPRDEVRQALALLQRVFEHSRDAILICQSEADHPAGTPPKVLFVNQAFHQMTGHGPELVGCEIPDLMVDGPKKEEMRRAFWNFEPARAELLNQRRDGSRFMAEVEVSPLSVGEDGSRYWVSARRETAEQHTAAHDFNNLLTVINGYGRILTKKLPPQSPLLKDVGALMCAGNRAISTAKQLLASRRGQYGEAHAVNLNALVDDLVPVLRDVLPADIELQCELGENVPAVLANGSGMEQVILNLLNNARDAMPGGGTLRLETKKVVPGEQDGEWAEIRSGEYALLRVSDTGCGMDEDIRSRLFEPFFTTKPKGSGTGLGLAQVSRAVQQSGGHIRVRTEVGSGSCFEIYLPGAPQRIGTEDTSGREGSERE